MDILTQEALSVSLSFSSEMSVTNDKHICLKNKKTLIFPD